VPGSEPAKNGFAVAALAFGIAGCLVAVVFMFFLALPLGVLAFALGWKGRRRSIALVQGRRRMATWGMALGVIAFAAGAIELFIFIVFFLDPGSFVYD
jgi:hypothetical protein